MDAGGIDAAPPVARCGALDCASGESCCFTTGECYDAESEPDACPRPPGVECASNADCAAAEVCVGLGRTCLGEGRCIDTSGCGASSRPVCGCDGETYRNHCAAFRAGVRVSAVGFDGECGEPQEPSARYSCESDAQCPEDGQCDLEINHCRFGPPMVACGRAEQCPEGSLCCPYTGACFDAACEDCCRQPPPGTMFPCRADSECHHFDIFSFCASHGCDDAPGGCRNEPSSCGGELEPVCGCDGVEYSNECWALREGLDIDPTGAACL